MGDPTQKLVNELCSLLDEVTILQITGDYDLHDPTQFKAARDVLLSISENVEAEEATGFNPSGLRDESSQPDLSSATFSDGGDPRSIDGLTTTTETSSSSGIHVSILDGLTDDEKERRLVDMFVSLRPIDIQLVLRKVKGDADAAMDELLNLQWLEQTGQRPKGIDAFYVSEEDALPGRKKGKGRKKRKNRQVVPTVTRSSSDPTDDQVTEPEPVQNAAADHENITHLSEWFTLPESESVAIYHRNGFSLGAAVVEILDNYLSLGLVSISHAQQIQIQEQEKRVPWISHDYLSAILDTTTSYEAAIVAIDILANHFEKPAYLKYDISYSIAAAADDRDLASGIPLPMSPTSTKAPSWRATGIAPTNLREAVATKATIAASANHSYASASAAFRKGKSDPLFRQAASFYAQRARDQAMAHRHAISAEAEHLVDSQSAKDTVDLHGVTVKDGVDIALDRTWRWWRGLGDVDRNKKARQGPQGGLKVITGLGRHSADGKSRLRINVFKALVAEGWRVEVLTGAYLVTGR
ncbi:hypothetical protein F5Y16DRAFT_95202 [Xylariaceae sp. FL0255]|nr:hypothetical protein F5Y16DRAFT_95202 [Xylariaceae sp. FL0255]